MWRMFLYYLHLAEVYSSQFAYVCMYVYELSVCLSVGRIFLLRMGVLTFRLIVARSWFT